MIYFPQHSLTEELNVLISMETASCNSIRTRVCVKCMELQSEEPVEGGGTRIDPGSGSLDYFKCGMIR